MSDGEQKLLDTQGDLLYAVRDEAVVEGAEWTACRVVLTNQRLILATSGNKQTIPLAKVALAADPPAVPAAEHVGDHAALRVGTNVILVSATDGGLEEEVCRAMLHDQVVLVKHPAVEGGVVQDTDWEKAKFRYADGTIRMALSEGGLAIDTDDVGTIDTNETTVRGEARTVVAVEHTEAELSVQTYLTGTERHVEALSSLFAAAVERNAASLDRLDEVESQVLMALYSGVSPFEMSDFVGVPPDEVEAVYQHLLEVGAVDEVRTRTEVALNARGRNLASDAMSEQ